MPAMWIALGFFVLVAVVGGVVVSFPALALFRATRHFQEHIAPWTEQFAEASAETERRLLALSERRAQLESARRRGGASLARARVLAAALRDSRNAFGRLHAVVPRK